jgi:hypothetical protein
MSKASLLRTLYIVAAIDAAIMGALSPWIIGAYFGSAGALSGGMSLVIMAPALFGAGAAFIALLAGYIFLAVKPYGWGKLALCVPGFCWVGFSLAASVVSMALLNTQTTISAPPTHSQAWLYVPLATGGLLLALAVLHQIIDPRWSGAPLSDSRQAA